MWFAINKLRCSSLVSSILLDVQMLKQKWIWKEWHIRGLQKFRHWRQCDFTSLGRAVLF